MPSKIHPRFVERALAPRYAFPEASLLTDRPTRTLRRWALGHHRIYQGRPRFDEPLIRVDGSIERGELLLSFLNLIELRFLASYRSHVSLPAIRRALDFAAERLHVKRPLLELDFAIHGRDLFLEYAAAGRDAYFINVSRGGQLAWPKSADFLMKSLDHDEAEGAVYRWWPLGKTKPVMLDTRLNGGHPSTSETGVRTDVIALRMRQGWTPTAVANDLYAKPKEIDAARKLEHAA